MNDVRKTIHLKIIELAKRLKSDARGLRYDESIPASGLLDSPSLMDLIVWFEAEFNIDIDQEHLTLDNFGSIDAMAAYLQKAST
jgi:acyl carrier protein